LCRRRPDGLWQACDPAARSSSLSDALDSRFRFRTGERVGHENLDAGSGRWPSFSAAALQAGFQSASAVPLRLRDVTIGALNLLSVTRAPMAEADVIVARGFADLAALSIAQHRASAEAQRLNEQLSGPLTSRVVIEQAKGVISERAGVDLAEAFARLRRVRRRRRRHPHPA
jgi:GAF domain-containing protein